MSHLRRHKEKILITSALPYVNNVPHMGNIIGCVLSADVFARYSRSQGNTVLYVCGTDEHGTTTEAKALEEGVTPRQICDKYYAIHKEVYEWFNISFDVFGRTSELNHHKIVQEIFADLQSNGCILEREIEQTYCPKDQKFLADRFIEGICPHCKYEHARGDQCENCGKLLNPQDLLQPRCKVCGTTPILKATTHLFLDLEELQPKLQEWVEAASIVGRWTQNALTTTNAWLAKGLEPRSITRDLEWGVPVPGYPGKVFYVWFDAPIGYISFTDQIEGVDYKEWWMNSDVLLYQFMAKDNIPFHTIVFPATLLGTKQPWTLLHHINSTEYLQHEDGKFSKSRGTGLFGDDAMSLGLPADVYRYYLLINRPETSDTTFTWKDLQDKLNNELIGNLGNLVHRTLSFVSNYQEGIVHESALDEKATNFYQWISEQVVMITDDLEWAREKDALKRIMAISSKANQYFQEQQPWKSRTADPNSCKLSLFVLSNIIKDLAILLSPFLPTTSERIFAQLGILPQQWEHIGDLSLHGKIGVAEPLFSKLEDLEQIQTLLKKDKIPEVAAGLRIQVGRIVDVFRHPKADKLFVEQVDFGGEIRNIVSGLAGHYRQEDLRGRTALFVTNLKSALLRGIESQGMILVAEGVDAQGEEKLEVLFVESEPGTTLLDESREITIKDFGKHTLEVKAGVVFVDGVELTLNETAVKTTVANGRVS